MIPQLVVLAKAPVPGRVKTRLCPPCTPEQAAIVAAASLVDTLVVVDAARATRRTLAISGDYRPPPGWSVLRQRGDGLGERLAHAFADLAGGGPVLLVGMDTPQISVDLLAAVAAGLDRADAVLGPAEDGGWWTLALRDPTQARALLDVPMSTVDTGRLTVQALSARGLTVACGPSLRDVDTAADAWAVAATCPSGCFAAAVRQHIPEPGPRIEVTPLGVYASALRRAVSGGSAVLEFVSIGGDLVGRVDTTQWTIDLRAGDESMLGRCHGATLDVGCGPGRLAAALHRRGQRVLGVDLCTEAVRQAHRRGAPAMRGDVFAQLPMEGGWGSVLLADGNIGIGGDPGRLLRRCTGLLDRAGRVVVEVHPPGSASWTGRICLQAVGEHDDDGVRSAPFPWARVAVADVAELAGRCALRVTDEWTEAGRWFVQLTA